MMNPNNKNKRAERKEKNKNLVKRTAVKRLLDQDQLSAMQLGRIMFLNNCVVVDTRKQLYNATEFGALMNKLKHTPGNYSDFVLYSRLVTFSIDEINLVLAADNLAQESLQSLDFMLKTVYRTLDYELLSYHIDQDKMTWGQFTKAADKAIKFANLKKDNIDTCIGNIRVAAQRIGGYAVFYDAMKEILNNDRRLIKRYRLFPGSREMLKDAQSFDDAVTTANKENKYIIDKVGIFPSLAKKTFQDVTRYADGKNIYHVTAFLESQFDSNKSIDLVQHERVAQVLRNGTYNR